MTTAKFFRTLQTQVNDRNTSNLPAVYVADLDKNGRFVLRDLEGNSGVYNLDGKHVNGSLQVPRVLAAGLASSWFVRTAKLPNYVQLQLEV